MPDGSGWGGIPDWEPDPATNAAYEASLADPHAVERMLAQRDAAPSSLYWGTGVLEKVLSRPGRPEGRRDRGTHVIGRDGIGPVIRWVPPGEPSDPARRVEY
jgi:hypothetical protein